jgi:hypothetical protein
MTNQSALRTVLILALAWASQAKAQDCDFPPRGLNQGTPREYRGFYENKAYSYSVTIPDKFVGLDSPNPFYQTGFGIILGVEPRSYILVDSQHNALGFDRAADAASRFLTHLQKRGTTVQSSKITEQVLGELKAAELVANYTCSGSNERYTRVSIVAISPDKTKLYELTLFAHADRYEQDLNVLDALARSWKYLTQ